MMYGGNEFDGGAAAFMGGGVMPSQAIHPFDPSLSISKNREARCLFPLTVKQICDLASNDESNFIIDGAEVNNASWRPQQLTRSSNCHQIAQKWIPPQPGIVKINTDAVVGSTGIGLGFLARDEKGGPIFSGALFLPHITDAQTTEAMALRDAITQARQWGYDSVIIETDCLQNTLALTTGDLPENYTGLVLEDVARMTSTFNRCTFTHTKRTTNVPAHELSQLALIFGIENVWIGECPEAIMPFVLADLN